MRVWVYGTLLVAVSLTLTACPDNNSVGASASVAAKAWQTAVPIETDSAGDAHDPQIVVDERGNALAVWGQSDGTRNNIWANRYQ